MHDFPCSAPMASNRNNNQLINIKGLPMTPKPNTAKHVVFTLLNTRSIRNKSLLNKDYVVEYDIDILALTETWLSPNDSDDPIIRDICPAEYALFNVPRVKGCSSLQAFVKI
jgi:hypothetical protein